MTYTEISANVLTVLCIVLAGQNSKLNWPVGIIASAIFGILFYNSKLYADSILQIFFIGTSLYGWARWVVDTELKSLSVDELMLYLVIGIAGAAVYGLILHKYTDAYAPFVDSAALAFSIVAQFLLMSRYKETWLFWILVNSISVPLFYSRGLYLTAGLYLAFLFHAIYAMRKWNLNFKNQEITL